MRIRLCGQLRIGENCFTAQTLLASSGTKENLPGVVPLFACKKWLAAFQPGN